MSTESDPGPRESEAQEAPTLPQRFFPFATESTPQALLGSSSEGRFAPSGKNAAIDQHSLGRKSLVFWLLLFTRAKCYAVRCEKAAQNDTFFARTTRQPEREACWRLW